MEGQLADYNLAMDKARTHANIADLSAQLGQIQQHNAQQRQACDDLFLKVTAAQRSVRESESQISQVQEICEQRVIDAENEPGGTERIREYQDLLDESASLKDGNREQSKQLDELLHRRHELEARLSSDEYQLHREAMALTRERQQLEELRAQLAEETESRASPEELVERMKQKLQTVTSDNSTAESRVAQLEAQLDSMSMQLRDRQTELDEMVKLSSKQQKYQAVFERDQKMTKFFEQYPQMHQQVQQEIQASQAEIVQLLKVVSKVVNQIRANFSHIVCVFLNFAEYVQHAAMAAPSRQDFREVKEDLSFKQQLASNNEETLQRLQLELDQRRGEVEKLAGLEQKIEIENVELVQKTMELQEVLHTPGKIATEDDVRREAEQTKRRLAVEIQRWKKQSELQRVTLEQLQSQYDQFVAQLNQSEGAKRFGELETRLKNQSQLSCSLHEWVQQKKRDSDYEQIQAQCLSICSQLNQNLIGKLRINGNNR